MRIEAKRPNILRLEYRQEKGDEGYGSCLWAFFDFDLDNWNLSISSDCGSAQYGYWSGAEGETFLHFLSTVHNDYLINKLYGRAAEVVDGEATIEAVKEDMKWWHMDDDDNFLGFTDEEKEAIEELEEKDCELDGVSSGEAGWILDEWANDNGLSFDCLWERVCTDYTPNQKKICEIWENVIRPKLKEMVANGEDHLEEFDERERLQAGSENLQKAEGIQLSADEPVGRHNV